MSEAVKNEVLKKVATAKTFNYIGKTKYRIDQTVVHVRFCNIDSKGSPKFKFNINPNTLTADYELWICGQADSYYLIPISIMHEVYSHPDAYIDARHPEIRVISLDIESHKLTYARGGVSLSLKPYWGAILN